MYVPVWQEEIERSSFFPRERKVALQLHVCRDGQHEAPKDTQVLALKYMHIPLNTEEYFLSMWGALNGININLNINRALQFVGNEGNKIEYGRT